MHEVGLVNSILESADRSARSNGATHIPRLSLRIGALSGVVVEAITFAWAALTPSTLAKGAELDIEFEPARCVCIDCSTEFEPPDIIFLCPKCASTNTEIRSGRSLEILSMEIS